MPFADLLPLFAQMNRNFGPGPGPGVGPGGPGNQPPDPALVGGILTMYFLCIGFIIIVGYTIRLLHARSMANCLHQIAPRNRTTEPGTVWLSAIPIIGGIFHIISMFKVPDSVKNEYEDRGWREDGDFGKQWAIIYLVGAFVAGPLAIIALIIFWNKISGYTKEMMSRGPGRYDDYGDDEDDRPRRRSRSRREYDDEDDDEDYRPRRRSRDD
jgi:hypothetical protein